MKPKYWASEPDSTTCVAAVVDRISRYREFLRSTGRVKKMQRSWSQYYGNGSNRDKDSSAILPDGEKGEIASMTVNYYGALVNQALVLITGSKGAFRAVAANSDESSLSQASLATGLIEYYDRKVSQADREYEAALSAVLLGAGYLSISWDAAGGQVVGVDPETGRKRYEGDVVVESHTPAGVAYDIDNIDFDKSQWVAIRRQANKWDLAEIYSNVADQILSRGSQSSFGQGDDFDLFWFESGFEDLRLTDVADTIFYWELHHLPSPACPSGRLVKFLDKLTVMYDSAAVAGGGYPYKELPLYRLIPEIMLGKNLGHSAFFDVLSLQQAIDASATIVMSAINAGGLMNMWSPPGNNIGATQYAGGLNVITSQFKPEAIDSLKVNPEIARFIEFMIGAARQRVSMNDVVMGQPDKGMPAQAMALLHAQAIQFHSRYQASYQRLVEKSRTGIIRLLQQFADTSRVALVAGKSRMSQLRSFKGADLKDIDRIQLEAVAPQAQTISGKMTLADTLLKNGFINKDEYILLYTTGRMEPMYQYEEANGLRIQREKELLAQGIGLPPRDEMGNFVDDGVTHIMPLVTDTHMQDIREYLAVAATPEARTNPKVINAITEIIQYKLDLWRNADPMLLAITNQPPPLPQVPAIELATQGGVQQPQPKDTNMPGGADEAPSTSPGGNPLPPGAPNIKLPAPPPNPITGEKSPPPDLAA